MTFRAPSSPSSIRLHAADGAKALRHGECSAPIPLFQPFAPRVPVLILIRSFSRFVAIASVIVILPNSFDGLDSEAMMLQNLGTAVGILLFLYIVNASTGAI
jgi:hypothetical protein